MATSLLSRRLVSGGLRVSSPSLRLFSTSPDPDTFTSSSSSSSEDRAPLSKAPRNYEPRQLEGGTDPGLYKAILVGKVGQAPIKRTLRSGAEIVLFSLATGGIRNHRRPLPHERPEEYADRCAVQWHRVSVYFDRLLPLAKTVKPGAVMYVEGNLESKIFSDPVTGVVRRIREIAIRGDGGRLLYLGSDEDGPKLDDQRARAVGFF